MASTGYTEILTLPTRPARQAHDPKGQAHDLAGQAHDPASLAHDPAR